MYSCSKPEFVTRNKSVVIGTWGSLDRAFVGPGTRTRSDMKHVDPATAAADVQMTMEGEERRVTKNQHG